MTTPYDRFVEKQAFNPFAGLGQRLSAVVQPAASGWYGRQLGQFARQGHQGVPLSGLQQFKANVLNRIRPDSGTHLLTAHAGGGLVGGLAPLFARRAPAGPSAGLLAGAAGAAAVGGMALAGGQNSNRLKGQQLSGIYDDPFYQKTAAYFTIEGLKQRAEQMYRERPVECQAMDRTTWNDWSDEEQMWFQGYPKLDGDPSHGRAAKLRAARHAKGVFLPQDYKGGRLPVPGTRGTPLCKDEEFGLVVASSKHERIRKRRAEQDAEGPDSQKAASYPRLDYGKRLAALRERRGERPDGSVDEERLARYRQELDRIFPAIAAEDLPTKLAVTLSDEEFQREHKHLIDVLRHGTKAERQNEAFEQAKEFNRHAGGHVYATSSEDLGKTATTIFLGGAVSGPQANWREPIKRKLWAEGHSVIDPKRPFREWNPLKHIYKELGGMMKADQVFFFRPGGFSEREKSVLDAARKPYHVVRKPEEILDKVGYQVTVPVDPRGAFCETPSPFPEDTRGHAMTTLRGALTNDLGMLALVRYLRTQSPVDLDPITLALLGQSTGRQLTRRR